MKITPFLDRSLWLEQGYAAVVIAQRGPFSKAPGHCLIVPRRIVVSVWDLYPEEWQNMYELAGIAKERIDREFKPDGYRLTINQGAAASQTVAHVHMHLMPCYSGARAVTPVRAGLRRV